MPGIPGRVRFGDIDSDGFPDALLTLEFSSEDGSKTGTVTGVWINEGGTTHNETTTETINSILGRSDLELYKNIGDKAGDTGELVTFLDIDEDGRLDLILQKLDDSGKPQIKMLYNNIVNDNFFIKALLLNSKHDKNLNNFGNNAVGATYRFVVTDMNDHKLVRVGS